MHHRPAGEVESGKPPTQRSIQKSTLTPDPSEFGFLTTTRQGFVTATLTYPLSPKTSVNGGVRYQVLRNDTASGYTEAAAFVGLNYTFH